MFKMRCLCRALLQDKYTAETVKGCVATLKEVVSAVSVRTHTCTNEHTHTHDTLA